MRAQVVVLAAGHSTRMGHPKALTRVAGEPALLRIVRVAEEAGLPRPLVVLGEHAEQVRAGLPMLEARVAWLRNPRPDAGRTGSLQRGLQTLGGGSALAWPVDHPLVAPATVAALAAAPGEWVVPEHAGRGGHPVKLGPMAVAAVLAAPASTPLRDVPGAVGLEATRLPVEDPGVLANLDTPEDVRRLGD